MNPALLNRAARGLFRSAAARELFFTRLAVIEELSAPDAIQEPAPQKIAQPWWVQ